MTVFASGGKARTFNYQAGDVGAIPFAMAHYVQNLHGAALLDDPEQNKGTAFTSQERRQFGLEGLLPYSVENLDRQVERVMKHLDAKPTDLERYIYLIGLSGRNETLFYRVVMSDPARFIPILYDPTVADACLTFGHIYRRACGMYITRDMKGRIAQVLRNWPKRDVRFVCVSTGGRILGLGDIGANGMGIPIGKLQLYTACAAVPPECLLPVLLDIGTTNDALRADPLYLGLREIPPTSEELDALVDEFVEAVLQVFPGCCVHFEDWKGTDAIRLLARYKDKILCYNDDIQGTAAIGLAGLTTALQIIGAPLTAQRILFFGAGSAAIGNANLMVAAMQAKGLSQDEARGRISMFDINGLLEPSRKDLSDAQKIYAHKAARGRRPAVFRRPVVDDYPGRRLRAPDDISERRHHRTSRISDARGARRDRQGHARQRRRLRSRQAKAGGPSATHSPAYNASRVLKLRDK